VIESHIIPGNFYSLGLPGNQVNSIAGDVLIFDKKKIQSRELVLINSIPIVSPDQVATNGVVHGISRVMLPKSLLEDCKCDKTTTNANTDTTTLGPVYNPTRASTQTPLRDETAPNSIPSTTNTETPPNVFFRREPSIANDDRNRNPKSAGNNFSDAPYVVSFTPTTTTSSVADTASTSATTTPTPLYFYANRRRVPPRNPITRQYDPRRTVTNRNTDPLFTEVYPYSTVTDYYSTPSTYYPYNPFRTHTIGGRNATDTESTPYEPTRRRPITDFYTDDSPNSPFASFPTQRQPFDRTRRPTFNNFNTFDTSTPTSTNTASTTLSPFFRRTYATNTDNLSTRTNTAATSTYETPLRAINNNNRRKPIFESRTTELPFWATQTTKQVTSNTLTSTRRIINDNTEPSTTFFDSTRRPTSPSTFDNRRGLSRGPNTRPLNTRKEDEFSTNEYFSTTSPKNRSPLNNITTTPANDDELLQTDPQTIDEIMDEPGLILGGKQVSFNTFKDNLRRAGLTNLMSSEGPFTVFMPTDEAFKSFSPSALNNLKKNPTKLRNMLLRHVTNVQIPPSALQNNFVVQTFSGDSLHISVEAVGKRVLVMGIPIMAATSARNGIIYVIGSILQPPSEEENEAENVVEEIKKRPQLTRFTKMVEKTRFNDILKGNNEFTLLVPDNSAFEELSPNIRQMIENDPQILESWLFLMVLNTNANFSLGMVGNHVIEGKYTSEQLTKIQFLPASSGSRTPLQFSSLPGSVIVNNDATFIQFDISCTNGIVHVINRFLVPDDITVKVTTKQPTFTEFEDESREPIISNESHGTEMRNAEKNSKFMKALRRAALLDKLVESRRDYTLLIPSDKAVDKLPEKLKSAMDTTPHRLKSLFNYHIIPEYVDFSNLKNDDILPSISGKPIRFNKYNNGSSLALSGAMIDKVSSEGNVLMIFVDRVLYPPQGNIYEILKRSPILKTLTKLVETAKLDRELSQSGPFTLFAPNDAAFNKLPGNTIQPLLTNSAKSREFLLRHVVQPLIFTSAIPVGKKNTTDVTNAAGERLKLQRLPDCVSVDGVTLSFADVTATNGVVHVIDHVL
ncbi:uncharacterized protein B4U80_02285, partial [Leptotrombidium deliense]